MSGWCAAPTTTRGSPRIDLEPARAGQGLRARPDPRGRAGQLVQPPEPARRLAQRRAGAGRGHGALPGEPIVAILAEPEAAARGGGRVKVSYEELPAVFDVEEALKPARRSSPPTARTTLGVRGPPLPPHPLRRRREGFAEADHIIEGRYDSSPIEHAPVETDGCIAVPEADGRITVYTQHPGAVLLARQHSLIHRHPAPQAALHRRHVGGGFGGKVDVIVEPIATLAAPSSPAGRSSSSTAASEEMQRLLDPGRLADLHQGRGDERRADHRPQGHLATSIPAPTPATRQLRRHQAAAHQPGPYTIPNVWVDGHCVYTNRTPSSAMRGFGVTMATSRSRSQMDNVAASSAWTRWSSADQRLPRRRHERRTEGRRGRGAGRDHPGGGQADRQQLPDALRRP
jgi:CO/xanthine dehydrogenase Mo-binding subunit